MTRELQLSLAQLLGARPEAPAPPAQGPSSDWVRDNPNIAIEDAFSVTRASDLLMEHDVHYRVKMSSAVTLGDMTDKPIVLIGGRAVTNIPATLSAITMKLLSKTAEERYQTAAGVERDLIRCPSQWESRGSIDVFTCDAQDIPDRLMIPEKLYGRTVRWITTIYRRTMPAPSCR